MSIKIILILFFLFEAMQSYGQCDKIVLNNQEDINSFNQNYKGCSDIKLLIINDIDVDIKHFDSLYSIERITLELIININNNNPNMISLSGFRRLRYLEKSNTSLRKMTGEFPKLDTIANVIFIPSKYNEKELFEFFPNIKHIKNSITITEAITDSKTPYFTTGTNFEIYLRGISGVNSTIPEVLSSRIKTSHFKSLYLSYVKDFDLEELQIIDSLHLLDLQECSKCNFSVISKLKKLKRIVLTYFNESNNNFGTGFDNVTHLDHLLIGNNRVQLDYNKLFPNLKAIDKSFSAYRNDSLINLNFLDNVVPPPYTDTIDWPNNKISVQDNPRLNNCNSIFLCKGIERYPDRVFIYDNHWKCSKEEVLKYCATISSTEDEQAGVIIYPNPSYGIIRIDGLTSSVDIRIFDVQGGVVGTFHNASGQLDISHLPSGLYIIELSAGKQKSYQRIVKMD